VNNREKFAHIPADKELNPRQQMFVEAYFTSDYNATEAARIAGYSGENLNKVGHELLSKPHIRAAIQKRAEERLKEISLTEEYVIRKLVRTIEKAEQDNNLTAVLRGIELAAKNLGMLRDKVEHTGKDGEAIKYEDIQNEAADFTRSISRIATRGREGKNPLKLVSGSESET
jgi:phage terminase small subunit